MQNKLPYSTIHTTHSLWPLSFGSRSFFLRGANLRYARMDDEEEEEQGKVGWQVKVGKVGLLLSVCLDGLPGLTNDC